MNLLLYWKVVKRQRRIVVIGLAVTLGLMVFSLVRVSPSGVALRSPTIYVADSTLFLKQGDAARNGADAAYQLGSMEYLAGIYARLAEGDEVRRLIDPTLKEDLDYQVATLKGDTGNTLPLISISAFASTPAGAAALANRVGGALQRYILANEASPKTPKASRVAAPMVVRPRPVDAEVFQGIHLTGPAMLFVLGMAVTIFAAFTRYNVQLARQPGSLGAELAQFPSAGRDSAASDSSSQPVAVASSGPGESSPSGHAQEAKRPATLALRPSSRGGVDGRHGTAAPRRDAEGSSPV